MTEQALTQKNLEQAINEAQVYFHNIPKLTPTFIQERIIACIYQQFHGQDIPLFQFELVQLNAKTYTVTVNKGSFATIEIGKEVCDE